MSHNKVYVHIKKSIGRVFPTHLKRHVKYLLTRDPLAHYFHANSVYSVSLQHPEYLNKTTTLMILYKQPHTHHHTTPVMSRDVNDIYSHTRVSYVYTCYLFKLKTHICIPFSRTLTIHIRYAIH